MVGDTIANMPSPRPKKTANLHPSAVGKKDAGAKLNVSLRSVASARKVQAKADLEVSAAVGRSKMSESNATRRGSAEWSATGSGSPRRRGKFPKVYPLQPHLFAFCNKQSGTTRSQGQRFGNAAGHYDVIVVSAIEDLGI